ncbi:hypothetical protein B0H16DRAFT_1617051 [Mycena metata]|uniref:SnoaL-like domain-containing protein n=1 Tax=Mycena metata TaxID=1033252 RepID=A0AAD7H8M3_9AGAR|nr:hypothetical protein B0H16DRAFT_1617051 [Mycena metata]
MSTSLIDWTAAQFTALYTPPATDATDAEDSNLIEQLDATFAPDAEIHLNHQRNVGSAKFKEFVAGRRGPGTKVECKPEDLVETPFEDGDADAGTIVAGTATLTRTHKFRIRAAPAQTRTVIIFSARIKPNPKPQIVELFHTAVDKPFAVNLHPAHAVDARAL